MTSSKSTASTIDEYIAGFPPEVQKRLEIIRTVIKTAAPEVREKISYGMPAFTLDGANLIYFAGWKRHVAIYPIPTGSENFNQQIAAYVDGKGTVKFPMDQDLPLKLIEQMIEYQIKSIRNKGEKK